ncbi:glyoxylate carboligase [Massilia sp. UYP32]
MFRPDDIIPAFERARALMQQYSVPVVVEIILERVTNIAMGTEIDALNEFNEVLDVK